MKDMEEIISVGCTIAVLTSVIYVIKNKWERDFIERVCIGGPL